MKLRLRRPLAMLLTVVMLLGLLPTAAFAVEEGTGEPSTAVAPADIKLDSAECEVGDEVTLNGSTTVSDGGTLSYQWYQSGDDSVDEADAADEEKNDLPLDGETEATLTVDTAETGTFYYYVVATNTVELTDGTMTTASTTSNVATVTVTAAEPVPPSGSNEPEDGQEPSNGSAAEGEQAPENDGEEPGNADDGDPAPQINDDAEITSLVLKNFTSFGQSGSKDLDLLVQEGAIQWDLFSPYTLEIGVSLPAGATDNKLTLTLPEGMKFVNLNPDNITGDGIESASWKKGNEIYTYQPDNGTLTVNFTSSAEAVTVSVSIQPDGAFFPPEKHEERISIEDAIQVQVNGGAGEESTAAVGVDVKTSVGIRVPYIGDIKNFNVNTAAGGTVTLEGIVYAGWLSASGVNLKRLVKPLSFALEVPEGFTVANASDAAQQWQITQGSTANGKTTWMFSATEGLYGTSRLGRISITVPEIAEEKAYPITLKEVSALTYGQDEAVTETYQDTTWTVTVKNPEDVEVQVKAENFPSVLNYTAIGNEEGTFDDYNSLLTAAVVTNEGLQAVNQSLIYEAEFDQASQFITAVGIPCGWGEEEYMPTSITVTYEDGTSTTLTDNGVETAAALATDGYGFVLRGEDISGYPEQSIAKIKVELSGLPQNYKSSVSPYFSEGNNAYNACRAYAGAWGRVREEVQNNTVATNQYSIYLEDEDAPTFTQVKTTYKNQAQISDEPITATLTVGGTAAATVNSGGLLHVKTPIRPSSYVGPQHGYESSLLDPVIYLLEPEDLSIENVKITTNTGAELTYRRMEITGQHTNLPNGYKLYEYTLTDKLMLGWWDADWSGTTLNLEFDYRVDAAAQTRSYDLRDLILFKSSLNLAFARYGEEDIYGLNGGNDIGTVKSNTFTVQATPSFNVATAIQIDGENKWYSYNPDDAASTTSVFTEGATANVKITVTNNSGATANDAEVYIPIPKKNSDILGEHFISQAGFDMFLAGDADLTSAAGWTVQYGQVIEVKLGENGVPTGEFELEGSWSDKYTNSTNMVKFTLSDSMANGTSAEIILKFRATNDADQTDSMNIFKSWYKYSTQNASIVDTEKVYNFGTLLQNGKLNGTVYVDTNRNGVKDVGENGIAGVTVKVTDSEGRTYETQTGNGGTYSFNSLPGKKQLTVTVINPESPDPNNSGGSYRFHALNPSEDDNIGSDVTPAEDNRSASKSDFTLTDDGTATVNAGLIEPYKVEFKTDSQGGVVSPGNVYIYADTKLSEVVKAVYVVSAGSGRTFTNQWKVGEDATDLIDHEELLDQTVTADTTFTAITSTAQCVVTFQSGAGQFTGDDAAKESITKNYDLNDTISSSDFPTVTHPQGNRLIGWTYNGETKTAAEWSGTTVTSNMTFTAQFAGDVTLTLIANGGQFASDARTTFTGAAGTEITIPTPTRTGWTFAGWYTAETGGTKIENTGVLPATNAIWYAHWTEGELKITVADPENQIYDGTPKTPSLTVKVGDTELTAGEDYVATYTDNVNVGTATVNVIGNGEYAGLTGTATFTINKANQTVTFAKPDEQTATYGETFANTATAQLDSTAAKITYSSSNTSIATVDPNTGEVTIHKAGEVTITATAAETSNVNEGKAEYKLTISKATPTLTFANSTVSVKTTGSVSNELTIKPEDLTVTYSSSNDDVAKVDSSTGEITLVGEGTATITATFAEDEKYNEAKASYTLIVDNDAIVYTAEGWYGTYDGTPHDITVNVTTPVDDATVTYSTTKDGPYTTDAPTYTNAGTYTVHYKIEAQGYDPVTGSAKVIINKAQLTDATVIGDEYTGQPVGSVSAVKAGVLTGLEKDKDYTVTFNNNVNAGKNTAMAVIMGTGNFTGTLIRNFTITPKALEKEMVSPIADQPYTGEQVKPDVTVADGTTPLVEGRDFTVTYGDNNTVGTNEGTVTIQGTGNYADKVEVSFNITNTGTFKVFVDNSEHTYNGSAHTPSVVVYAVDEDGVMTPLVAGTDYEVSYADNMDAGTASVTITGKGAYAVSGESWKAVTEHFTINKADQIVTFAGVTDDKVEKTYGDSAFTQAATVALRPDVSGQTPGTVTYASSNPAVATVGSDGKVTIVGAGAATITASAAATQNYKGAEASYTLTVKPKDINSEDVTASKIPDQPYGGIPVTPDFSLTDSDSDITKHNLEANVDYTFEYSDNNDEGEGKITITGKGNYTGTKEVTFKIIPWSESQVVVTPAPITIYMGGADGYEHVIVDEDTGEIKASSSLPEPGFLFTLPKMLKEALEANSETITAVKFYELASGKEWTVVPYAEGSSTVYRLVPGEGQAYVRVQFTNAQGETVTEDQFDVGRNVNQKLTMTLYKGEVTVINAIYDGVKYPIQLGESTLTVRGVTDEAQYATVTGDATAPVEGKPAVTAESGTSYTINGSDVSVEDTSGVALLFDSIIDASGEDRTGLLEDKAEDTMAALNKEPASGNRFAYAFQYLDLVDTNNGNAWVKASEDVTIYWPYPAGTNQDTEFTLLHFEGLHREMDTSEIGDQIAKCKVSKVTIEEKTDTHIVLKVGSAGFSPFALVWEEKIPTYTITATSNGNSSITPAGVTTVQEGGSQSYTIKADNGYHISDVKVNGASVGAVESYTFTNVQSNQTIAVTFSRNSSGGGGGGGGHTKPSDPDEDIPDEPGPADPFDTGVGNWLNTKDHTAYLGGYGGGLFGPDDNMTRGQAAQMFYNLLLDKDVPITVSFTDVAPDAWYSTAVNTLASLGIVTGYGNGQFGPDDSITRAQFTTIAMRFANLDTSGENIFTDVSEDDWFYEFVVGAIKYGWIGGYPDGRFGPNDTITRAQVTTIVNRMLGRSADEDYVERNIEELTRFTDVPDTHWSYYNIMEATNAHDYDRVSGGEDWTRLHK